MTMGRPKGEPMYPLTLSIPISESMKDQLSTFASAKGLPIATYARLLIMKGIGKR
jgi:hypothetical protein